MGSLERPFTPLYNKIIQSTETKWLRAARQNMLHRLTGRILDIDAGTGANFPHYSLKARVTAIEPSKHFFKRPQSKLATISTNIQLESADAKNLPFEDDTFDTTIATLVFCTIKNPMKALSEVRRLTKPKAQLLLIEHVQANTPIKRLLINLWNPAQQFLARRCNLNQATKSNVTNARFQIEETQLLTTEMGSPHLYIRATNLKESS